MSKKEWAAKSLRSGFGKQCTSNKPSSPGFGFGSSSRDAFKNQYASAEVDKAKARSQGGDNPLGAAYNVPSTIEKQITSDIVSPPKVSFSTSKRPGLTSPNAAPGPGAYKVKPALGDVVESTRISAPRMRFGTAHRDAAAKVRIGPEHDRVMVGGDSPGPSYNVPGALGKQQLSTKRSLPSFKLGTGPRFVSPEMREAMALPGPGAFSVPSTIGAQVASDASGGGGNTICSSPTCKFGTSTRDQDAKVFISLEHEKGAYGTQSPGPVTASPLSALGKQQLSTKHSSPTIGFGTGKRLIEHATDVPGPGAYYA